MSHQLHDALCSLFEQLEELDAYEQRVDPMLPALDAAHREDSTLAPPPMLSVEWLFCQSDP